MVHVERPKRQVMLPACERGRDTSPVLAGLQLQTSQTQTLGARGADWVLEVTVSRKVPFWFPRIPKNCPELVF